MDANANEREDDEAVETVVRKKREGGGPTWLNIKVNMISEGVLRISDPLPCSCHAHEYRLGISAWWRSDGSFMRGNSTVMA